MLRVVLLCLLVPVSAAAESNTVTLDPISGAIGFTGRNLGEWGIGYERRIGAHHGVFAENTWVHVHRDPFHLTTTGLGVGYRYHLRPAGARSSPFVGAIAGGKLGFGRLGDAEPSDLTARAVYVTGHAGYRWTSARGLTITARLGLGYAHYMLGGAQAGAAEPQMDDRLKPLPVEIDSELGIGYSF